MNSQMTIGSKITFLSGLLVIFTIVVGAVALVSMARMETATLSIVADALPGVYVIGKVDSISKDIRKSMLMHIATDSQEEMAQLEATVAQDDQKLRETLKGYEKTITTTRDRELYERVSPAYERYIGAWNKQRALSRAMKTQEALAAFRSETLSAAAELQKAVSELADYNKANGDELSHTASRAGSAGRFWTWSILLLATLSGIGLSFWIVRGTNRVLRQSVAQLSEGAEQVSSAASQVSSSSQSLAQGSSEQAASLEETSASSEEINSMARKNHENCHAASTEMAKTAQVVTEANERLAQMVASMKDITDSSNKISKIIKVIDEIAFQTNILALNAAVEAARAGEAGMGFAVVAEEVRNLAQRSAQAAKDTASLIEESIEKSTIGSRHLDLVAEGIRTITASATQVKTLVDEVNLGSQEQARGIEQVAKAIVQMEQVTQKTAANAEESAAAAEELTAQSEALKDVVERLTGMVNGGGPGHGGHPGANRRKRTAGNQATGSIPPRALESASGLSALQSAVSNKANGHAAEMALARKESRALPLDGEFTDFR